MANFCGMSLRPPLWTHRGRERCRNLPKPFSRHIRDVEAGGSNPLTPTIFPGFLVAQRPVFIKPAVLKGSRRALRSDTLLKKFAGGKSESHFSETRAKLLILLVTCVIASVL